MKYRVHIFDQYIEVDTDDEAEAHFEAQTMAECDEIEEIEDDD